MPVSVNSKTVILTTFQEISDDHDRLHLRVAEAGAVLPYQAFEYNQKGNQENGCIILLSLDGIPLVRPNRNGVWVGVRDNIFRLESESELAALKINRLHSPGEYLCYYLIYIQIKNMWSENRRILRHLTSVRNRMQQNAAGIHVLQRI